ncbi:hypothetical protein VB711_12870 [Cronbergia sp. UHCC 0137]|uniref:hypothetical protein n=1 Tax=Cronbergia sp. UHCC 0137 TaxID=3110239 RepID=UPI002B216976|nr:hypothetical protein [Cronbergia sp. UHCC 0137]MEA5618723.1 hypothetical protein [Cronbergia sp. UHCC 0137]
MRFILRIIGLSLLLLGIYLVGKNIFFTTNVYPYWWRGIAADTSVLALTIGIIMLIFFPRNMKNLGWIAVSAGVIFVFMSSSAILNPMSLWQFFLSLISISAGYKMFTTGRIPF